LPEFRQLQVILPVMSHLAACTQVCPEQTLSHKPLLGAQLESVTTQSDSGTRISPQFWFRNQLWVWL